MGVVFKGGTSGDGYDYLPDVSRPYDKQEPQDTATNRSYPDVQYTQNTGNRDGDETPQVPNCGTPDDSAV